MVYTICYACGRSGSAREDTNYIFECMRCVHIRKIKQLTQ